MNPIKSLLAFKTVYSENKTYLVFSVGRKEAINYTQVQTLESEAYREYFLPFQCTKTANTNKIGYDISGLTALSEYLKTEMRQDQYFEIISGIQKIFSFCQKSHFSYDNLICDPKYMYYHNVLKKVMMIYIPLNNQHYVCDDVPKCLMKMHKCAKNLIITDGNYMNNYEKYLASFQGSSKKRGKNFFSPDSLLHFFNSNHMNGIEKGTGINQSSAPEKAENAGFPINAQIARPQPDDMESSSNTVVRLRKAEAFLTDESGNRYDIENFPFSIGRNKKKDLVIEQPTVSGEHAVISEMGGRYYINDTSSNGTYLNDENNRITSEEIRNGDKLYFDRFCYTFYVTRNDGSDDEESSRTVVVARRHDGSSPAPAKAESSGKALAYLTKNSDNSMIRIMSFPFRSDDVAGMVITCEAVGDRKGLFVENISCSSLDFEGLDIPAGSKAELFSGCSLIISGEKYTFNIEN